MSPVLYHLRVVFACMDKEIKAALTEHISAMFIPMDILILMSLFAVSSVLAPMAAMMEETGLYARQFYTAVASARPFRLQMVNTNGQCARSTEPDPDEQDHCGRHHPG